MAFVSASAVPDASLVVFPARERTRASTVAWFGVCLWLATAPFEATRPLVRLPGQSLTSVEAALLAVMLAWGGASLFQGGLRQRIARLVSHPLATPMAAFETVVVLSALLAAADRANALRMAARFALAACACAVALDGLTTRSRIQLFFGVAALTGAVVSIIAILESAGVPVVLDALKVFRPGIAVVGAQVRAAGPFQYPTIASMYLEIVFAFAVALLPLAVDSGRRAGALGLMLALALISEGIVVTFTRSGLITAGATLLIVGAVRWRDRGFDAGATAIAGVACIVALELLTSRSLDVVRLRMITETPDAWYQMTIDAPAEVDVPAGATVMVPVTVTNEGLAAWDSHAEHPIRLGYHWLAPDGGRSIDFEGLRTDFASPVPAGATVSVTAKVRAPREPGDYQLMWDVVQEGRLWLSSQPDAEAAISAARVTGTAASNDGAEILASLPKRQARPGRLALWGAAWRMWLDRPLLGVGPDNFRLLYGPYARVANADPRLHANNMYVEMLADSGVLGLAALVWLGGRALAVAVSAVKRSRRSGMAAPAAGVLAACTAIAVHGLVDSFFSFTATYVIFAITLGLAVACDRLAPIHAHRV